MSIEFNALKAPFPASEIKWRVGKTTKDKSRGLALAYIDSRAVMDRLDEVCGPQNWKRVHDFGTKGEILCGISIKVGDEWVEKWDGAAQTNFEAEKGGLSDSFKRAAVSWGIGRYLYNLPATWCDLDQYKNIKNPPKLPRWALPNSNSSRSSKANTTTSGKKVNSSKKADTRQSNLTSEQQRIIETCKLSEEARKIRDDFLELIKVDSVEKMQAGQVIALLNKLGTEEKQSF